MNEQPTKGLYIDHERGLREQRRTESVCGETGGFPTTAADGFVTMVLVFKSNITFRYYWSARFKFMSINQKEL